MTAPLETGPPEPDDLLHEVDALLAQAMRAYLRHGYTLPQAATNLVMRARPALAALRADLARAREERRQRGR